MAAEWVLALLDVAELAKLEGWTGVTLPFVFSWRLFVDGTERTILRELDSRGRGWMEGRPHPGTELPIPKAQQGPNHSRRSTAPTQMPCAKEIG